VQSALVLSFDARQMFFGGLTRDPPGLVIRAWETDEMRQVGRLGVEVRGGEIDFERLFGTKLTVQVIPEETGPGRWRGVLQFEPGQFAELPVARAVRDVRSASSRIVVQYQGGGGSMRIDLPSKPKDPLALQAAVRQRLISNGVTASLRLVEVSEPIESWDPPPLILP